MLDGLKKQWRQFRADPPGSRFRLRYERRQRERKSPLKKIAWSVLGVAVIAGGIVLLPAPGPGIPVVVLGVAILGEESLYVSRALDWCELKLRGGSRRAK